MSPTKDLGQDGGQDLPDSVGTIRALVIVFLRYMSGATPRRTPRSSPAYADGGGYFCGRAAMFCRSAASAAS